MNPTLFCFEENQPVAGRLRPLGIAHVPRDAAKPAQTLGCGEHFCRLGFHRETLVEPWRFNMLSPVYRLYRFMDLSMRTGEL